MLTLSLNKFRNYDNNITTLFEGEKFLALQLFYLNILYLSILIFKLGIFIMFL